MKTLFEKILSYPDAVILQLKSIKDEIAAAHHTYKSTNDEKQTKPVVHVLSRSQAEIDEDQRRHVEQRGYQNRNLLINTLYTCVTLVIAIATIISAVVAKQSVKTSKDTAEAVLRQSRLEQRAWIGIVFGPIFLGSSPGPTRTYFANPLRALIGQPFSIRMDIKNIGKTPAYNVRSAEFHTRNHVPKGTSPNPTFNYKESDFKRIGILMPGAGVFNDYGEIMTHQDYEDIVEQRLLIYDYGRIEYDDAYGFHHWYNFCQFMTTGGAFGQCPAQNDTDQTPD